ncbi:MAG: nitroreductase family protein [Thermotogota bacterium]
MDTYPAIRGRRTIRDFELRPIDQVVLDRVLGAGLRAPMHDPKDGRRFIVVDDAAVRAELVRGVLAGTNARGDCGGRRLLGVGGPGAARDVP